MESIAKVDGSERGEFTRESPGGGRRSKLALALGKLADFIDVDVAVGIGSFSVGVGLLATVFHNVTTAGWGMGVGTGLIALGALEYVFRAKRSD